MASFVKQVSSFAPRKNALSRSERRRCDSHFSDVACARERFVGGLLTGTEWSALRLSFQVAACAALAGLPLAIAVGYLLARASFVGKWLIEVLVKIGRASCRERV